MVRVTPPVCLPISKKDWELTMRIKMSAAFDEVNLRIKTATELVEQFLGRVLVAQTWDMYADDYENTWPAIYQTQHWADSVFWNYAIELRKPPLQAVTGVFVRDEFGVETTVPQYVYYVSSSTDPGRISLQPGQVWPYHRGFEGFRIRLVAGYVFPFQTADGILTAPGHTLQSGQVIRLQRGPSDALPSGLFLDSDYTVTNVVGNTLQLLDSMGNLTAPADLNTWNFLGEIPEPIRRAIVITSALEIGSDAPNRMAEEGRYAPVILPVTAEQLLEPYRMTLL
jgi:hypothetical protein